MRCRTVWSAADESAEALSTGFVLWLDIAGNEPRSDPVTDTSLIERGRAPKSSQSEGNTVLAGVGTNVLFEDDKIKVWEFILEPGEQTALHTHEMDYIFY